MTLEHLEFQTKNRWGQFLKNALILLVWFVTFFVWDCWINLQAMLHGQGILNLILQKNVSSMRIESARYVYMNIIEYVHPKKLTQHLKMDGGNTSFCLGFPIFRCYVSLGRAYKYIYILCVCVMTFRFVCRPCGWWKSRQYWCASLWSKTDRKWSLQLQNSRIPAILLWLQNPDKFQSGRHQRWTSFIFSAFSRFQTHFPSIVSPVFLFLVPHLLYNPTEKT